jgi:hypothetical protein
MHTEVQSYLNLQQADWSSWDYERVFWMFEMLARDALVLTYKAIPIQAWTGP